MLDRELHMPELPGVYLMKGAHGRILYVGKAANLRARVNQYLSLQDSRAFVPRLLEELTDIEFIVTGNEKDALLLEAQLVRRLKPPCNVRLRDDKNFLIVRTDMHQPYPRLELVRRKSRDRALYLGPFTAAHPLREYVRFLNRHLRLRTCRDSRMHQRQRPCLLFETARCSGPCAGTEDPEAYRARVRQAVELLSARHQEALDLLAAAMRQASDETRYEDAAAYRDLLASLHQLWGRQQVALCPFAEADIFAVHSGPLGGTVYVLLVRDHVVTGNRSFFGEGLASWAGADMESILFQFYQGAPPPAEVVADLDRNAAARLEQAFRETLATRVRVETPARGRRKALYEMALVNARLACETQSEKARSRQELLRELAAAFDCAVPPDVVECVDISSFQGGDAVGSVALAREGLPAPAEYRAFHVRGSTADDFTMIEEVVRRRIRQTADSPDRRLMLIDGGRAHLRRAHAIVLAAQSDTAVAAIAKARPEQGLPTDRVFLPGRREPLDLAPDSRVMHFVQMLRDEAHRFGLRFHRKVRTRRALASPLLEIPGIGRRRRTALLKHFGSLAALKAAAARDLRAIPGLPDAVADRIFAFFHPDVESAPDQEVQE